MPRSDYRLTIHVHDDTTLDILNKAPYKLRVGNPPPLGPTVFEPPENKIPFSFLQDHGSDDSLSKRHGRHLSVTDLLFHSIDP